MNSIYGANRCNDEFTDMMTEKLKTESIKELEEKHGLIIVFVNGVSMQGEKLVMCKAVRIWEDTQGFEEETERRVAELFGTPVKCEHGYGEHYCSDSKRSF
jgi:hypothetical protein